MCRGVPYQFPHVVHKRTNRAFQNLPFSNAQFCKSDSLSGAADTIVLDCSPVVGFNHPGDKALSLEQFDKTLGLLRICRRRCGIIVEVLL